MPRRREVFSTLHYWLVAAFAVLFILFLLWLSARYNMPLSL